MNYKEDWMNEFKDEKQPKPSYEFYTIPFSVVRMLEPELKNCKTCTDDYWQQFEAFFKREWEKKY